MKTSSGLSVPPSSSPRSAAAAFREAEEYERAHPDDRAGAVRRYERIARDSPGTPEAGKATVNVIRLRSVAAREKAQPLEGGWRPVFDGRTTDCVHRLFREQWRVVDGALVNVPGLGQAFTQRDFADCEIRFRFELQGLTRVVFGVRHFLHKPISFLICYEQPLTDSMEGKVHELIFVCRGTRVTAGLDGRHRLASMAPPVQTGVSTSWRGRRPRTAGSASSPSTIASCRRNRPARRASPKTRSNSTDTGTGSTSSR